MKKFCFDCEAQNSTHVRIVNSILIENSSIVSFFAFDEKNIISYKNLFSISDSFTVARVVIVAFDVDVDFDSSTFLFDHVSALISRFHTIQNRTIANVRREQSQEKKKSQALQFESSSLFEKEKAEESFKKLNRVVRTMMYFYLKHVRKTIDQNVKISRKQIKFNKLRMFY
jgi:hypothetical protein